MTNMAYCRFENTAGDLGDCYEWLGEHDPSELSADELRAYMRLVKLCVQIADEFGDTP